MYMHNETKKRSNKQTKNNITPLEGTRNTTSHVVGAALALLKKMKQNFILSALSLSYSLSLSLSLSLTFPLRISAGAFSPFFSSRMQFLSIGSV